MVTATSLMNDLDGLQSQLNNRNSAINAAIVKAQREFEGIVRVAGSRDDYAQAILEKQLRSTLEDLQSFTSICLKQLDAIKANPFGE